MKKILVFTSTGGRGHISATEALQEYFGDAYTIEVSHIFRDVLRPLDLLQILTRNRWSGEDLYNWFVKRKWFRLLNILYATGAWHFFMSRKKVKELVITHIKEVNPDLVISVIPIINGPILHATKQLDIPFLLIPTDLDSTTFIHGIDKPAYANFDYAIAFNDSDIRRTIAPAHIPEEQIHVTGFPVRTSFLTKKDLAAIKKEFDLPDNKSIILVILGGAGSWDMPTFLKELSKIPTAAHIVLCIGRAKELEPTLKKITVPAHIGVTILGFTMKIADLMAVADICITKSGSVSVCEALYSEVPIILDASSSVLKWEQFNHQFVHKRNLGLILKKTSELSTLVMKLLGNKERYAEIKRNLHTLEKRDPRVYITELVKKIIE